MKNMIKVCVISAIICTVMSVSAAASGSEDKQKYNIEIQPETYQTIEGWGIHTTNSWMYDKWLANKEAQKAILKDLGITIVRSDVNTFSGDGDGNLNYAYLSQLADVLQNAAEYGQKKYFLSVWSPPKGMKEVKDGYWKLRPDKRETYVKYLVDCLDYLTKQRGLPHPVGLSPENEPGMHGNDLLETHYEADDYAPMVILLKKELVSRGYGDVAVLSPESAGYNSSSVQLGKDFSAVHNNPKFEESFDIVTSHPYTYLYEEPETLKEYVTGADYYKQKPRWSTEYCFTHAVGDPSGKKKEINQALYGMKIFNADITWVGVNLWCFWLGWVDMDIYNHIEVDERQSLIYGSVSDPMIKGRCFNIFKTIFNNVPQGSKAKKIKTDDPDINYVISTQCDVSAFETEHGSVLVLINDSGKEKNYTFTGLEGNTINVFNTSPEPDDVYTMNNIYSGDIKEGKSGEIKIPAQSISVIVCDKADKSFPHVDIDTDAPVVEEDGKIITDRQKLTINGHMSEKGSLTINGTNIALDDSLNFKYSFDTEKQTDIHIAAVDNAGNAAPEYVRTFTYIKNYPGAVFDDVPSVVNSEKYTLKGTLLNENLNIYVNGEKLNKNGNAFAKELTLAQGDNNIEIIAENSEGKKNTYTKSIYCDSIDPEIEFVNALSETNDTEYIIYGKTSEELSSITVNGKDMTIYPDKYFEKKMRLKEGENKFTVKATDMHGNVTEKEISVNCVTDSNTPKDTDKITYSLYTTANVKTDGNFDEPGWKLDNKATIEAEAEKENNNIVNFGTMWDEKNLYIAAEVKDNRVFFGSDTIYNNDVLELYFNPTNSKAGALSGKDCQMWFGFADKSESTLYQNSFGQYTYKKTDTGYKAEIAIPWKALGIDAAEGTKIGFDIGCDEQDILGQSRQGVMFWSGTNNNWADTSGYGTLILSKDAEIKYVLKKDNNSGEEKKVEDGKITVLYNGVPVNFQSITIMDNGFAMVPVRDLCEAMGYSVQWEDGTVAVSKEGKELKIRENDKNAVWQDGSVYEFLKTPKIYNGRTYVPLRFVYTCLGYDLNWTNSTSTGEITSG